MKGIFACFMENSPMKFYLMSKLFVGKPDKPAASRQARAEFGQVYHSHILSNILEGFLVCFHHGSRPPAAAWLERKSRCSSGKRKVVRTWKTGRPETSRPLPNVERGFVGTSWLCLMFFANHGVGLQWLTLWRNLHVQIVWGFGTPQNARKGAARTKSDDLSPAFVNSLPPAKPAEPGWKSGPRNLFWYTGASFTLRRLRKHLQNCSMKHDIRIVWRLSHSDTDLTGLWNCWLYHPLSCKLWN